MDALLDGPLLAASLVASDSPQRRLLAGLQGNILQGHKCPHAFHLFLNFRDGVSARTCLREMVADGATFALTRAIDQLDQLDQLDRRRWLDAGSSTPFIAVALSHQGYLKLGIDGASIPEDSAFLTGMRKRGPVWLGDDSSHADWDAHFRQPEPNGANGDDATIHALVTLAGESRPRLDARLVSFTAHVLAHGIHVVGREPGDQLVDGSDRPIEHFGFLDNLSSPVFIDRQDRAPRRWNPVTSLQAVLRACKGGSYGSYVVFRKLEQNVRRFAQTEAELAQALCLSGPDAADRAGALIIGRRRDGSPLVPDATGDSNDFDYQQDLDGIKCPFASHVRKMNPRGTSDPQAGPQRAREDERPITIARRGMTYGARPDRHDPRAPLPETGVGLLFICYQGSIERQFEKLIRNWANSASFPPVGVPPPGRDLLIGQGPGTPEARLASDCPQGLKSVAVPNCITLKGGEYFFAPSIDFFRNL